MTKKVLYSLTLVLFGITTTLPFSIRTPGNSLDLDEILPPNVNALVILKTSNVEGMQKAIGLIQGSGGRVVHIFPTHVLIGSIPASTPQDVIGQVGIEAIHRSQIDPGQYVHYGDAAAIGIHVWNALLEAPDEHLSSREEIAALPLVGDTFLAPSTTGASSSRRVFSLPGSDQTSTYMIGDVVVGIVLPESTGNGENWTEERQSRVANEIIAGTNWWAARESSANLTFVYDVHFNVPTNHEPIQLRGGPPWQGGEEHLWIWEVLAGMGYSGTDYFAMARNYVNDIRNAYGANWAFAVFVADSQNDPDGRFADGKLFAYTYIGGPFVVMTYDNDRYEINNMDAVIAHEMGHVFGALDQYHDAQVPCDKRSGFLQVENQNSEYGPNGQIGGCLSNVGSIMRGNVPPYTYGQADFYARGQVGWWDQNDNGVLDPLEAGPPPFTDDAIFLSDVTLPDGTVVSPGQALHKVWRVRNSGTSTWDSGYQLAFTSGEQMGAPSAVDVPGPVSPNATVDLSVDMTAPSNPGHHVGHWRLRNAQGVYFGDELWIDVVVPGDPQEGDIAVLSVNYPSVVAPGEQFRPEIRVRVNTGVLLESRGDMLRNTDGNLYGAWLHVAVVGTVNTGGEYTFQFYQDNPITAPPDVGFYESRWQVWQDGRYVGPEVLIRFEVQPSDSLNHPPNPPSLVAPPDYYVSDFGAPTLQAQHNGDPDGDPITAYYFEIFDSHDNPSSGWIAENNWTPPELGLYGYLWHVKVRDSRGAESGWSETRQFLIEDPGPQIYDFHWEWCREAWGGSEKICFCADTNAGTLQVQVNMATDGSENGEWRIINELGVPQYMCNSDDDRPPNWGQLEAEAGTHLARLYARREGGWEAAATADIFIDLPPGRRPNSPDTRQPPWEAYVNTQTIHFDWLETLRTTDYHLVAGTNPDPDQNPLLDIHTSPGTSEYTFTFADDYPTLYWKVTATGPYGTNDHSSQFHIDIDPPSSAINALPAVTTDTAFAVNWGGSDARSGLRWYDVQFRDGERGEWVTWMAETAATGALFRGEAGHTYYFRCRAMDQVGNWEAYPSGDGDTHTLVDPTAAPPTAWWNDAYSLKRNVVVLNNDGSTMSIHYPVHLHFDSSTTPTAAEMYDASQSAVKGDDFRIVYDNTAELDRQVQAFSPTEINIWFPLQANLGGGQSSEGEYQLYYGNPDAANPPADVNDIFLPVADEHTMGLWHFQEGSGNTVHDTSGRNHHGTFYSPAWIPGFLGTAGDFDGSTAYVDVGNSDDFNLADSPMTLEAWIYLTDRGSYPHIISKWGLGENSYLFRLLGGHSLHFLMRGGGEVNTGAIVELNRWYHVAATYDGTNTLRIFVNGNQQVSRSDAQDGLLGTKRLFIGWAEDGADGGHFPGYIQHVRVSNIARSDFSYAGVEETPSVEAGSPIPKPGAGTPNLAVQSLATYPTTSEGVIVQAVVRNEGDASTQNGFYTDLYADHLPTGAGDYTGSVRFWIASPIEAGATVTLTTVITDVTDVGGLSAASLGPLDETSVTLYTQVDSEGVVTEPDEADNISSGLDVCTASADAYEGDDIPANAQPIAPGETQRHNFDSLSDQDWVKLTAQGGMTYTIQTSDLGPAADTYLYLYDIDGSTLLAANDDYGGSLASQIEWTAPVTGTYYVLVKHWNPNVAGCGTSYTLSVAETQQHIVQAIYLPLVLRNFAPATLPTPTPSPTLTGTPTQTSTPTSTPTPTYASTPTPTPTPTPGWHVECVDCPRFFADMTDHTLALDTDGHPHIAYGGNHLYYARYDGSQWHTEVVDGADGVGGFASLALDSANHPHIGYYDATNHDLKYAFWDGSSWVVQTVDSEGEVGLGASLALDSADHPHLVYYDRTHQDLKYASWDGATWNIEAVDGTASWWWWGQASLALDSLDRPHVSYYQGTDGSLKYATKSDDTWTLRTVDVQMGSFTTSSIAIDPSDRPHISYGAVSISPHELRYASWNGTSWEIQTVTQIGEWGGLSSLAFDSAGQPHLSFQDWNGYKVKYASWDGSEWVIEDVGSVGWWGGRNSLVLDASGQPHIAYHNWSPFQIQYAAKNGANWTLETVDTGGNVGAWSSVDVDANGYPHIAYHDDPNMHLRYASYDGVAWTTQTADEAWGTGEHTSLALDSAGHPHISHCSWGNNHLRYNRWDGINWAIQVVDASDSVGGYTSLALDSNEHPHISYHDWDNQALKYAAWDGQSWVTQTVDSVGDGGGCSYTSIAIDPYDNPSIAYYDANSKDLKVARWDGGNWVMQTVDSEGDVGCSPAITFDSNGRPSVAYYDLSEGKLQYASWDGTSWHIQTVTSQGTWAPRSALVLDEDDRPHIAYTNGYVENDAMYAYWDGTGWVVETIEEDGDVGSWISLALDLSGFPHMSYHDSTNGALKHAWRR